MMMLYEEGKWRLDDPVSRYIPEFAQPQGLRRARTPTARRSSKTRGGSMTMRELMTHTAGSRLHPQPANPVDKMIIDGNVLNAAQPLQTMIDGLGEDAAARAAGHALVLQHRGRCAGISRREVLGHAVRRVSRARESSSRSA